MRIRVPRRPRARTVRFVCAYAIMVAFAGWRFPFHDELLVGFVPHLPRGQFEGASLYEDVDQQSPLACGRREISIRHQRGDFDHLHSSQDRSLLFVVREWASSPRLLLRRQMLFGELSPKKPTATCRSSRCASFWKTQYDTPPVLRPAGLADHASGFCASPRERGPSSVSLPPSPLPHAWDPMTIRCPYTVSWLA